MISILREFTPRSEIELEEVPAPQKLAQYSFAFTADVSNGLFGDQEDELASGRFVVLHEPGGQDTWEANIVASPSCGQLLIQICKQIHTS